MNTAVGIIERRVNGLGVSEAEVQTQGRDNIIVNIPKGTNSKQAREQVGTTAQLYFRPVLTVTAAGHARRPRQPLGIRAPRPSRAPVAQRQGRRQVRPDGHPLGQRHHPGPRGHRAP